MTFPVTRNTTRQFPAVSVTPATGGDRVFQWLAIVVILLEIVVLIEPAPVDGLIVFCLMAGLLSGKLGFAEIGSAALFFIGLFALANVISLYEAFDPAHAIAYLVITLYLITSWLFFTGLIGRYGTPLVKTLIQAYCVAGLISALMGACGYFHLVPFDQLLLLNGRARGLFKDCNVYGPFFVPMALFAIVRLTDRSAPARTKLWQALILWAACLGMLLSFSRACWANCGVALAVFFIGQILIQPPADRRRWLARLTLLLVAGGASLALLLNVPVIHKMFLVRANSNHFQDYDRVRFATQAIALETGERSPFGIGPGQSEEVFRYATHSMYLRILAENGPIALFALAGFIVTTMTRCVTLIRHAEDRWVRELNLAILACICGHLLNSMVIDTVHWRSIWFIYALPWIAARVRPRVPSFPELTYRQATLARVKAPQWARI